MAQYIDKSALVAEIERRQKIHFNDYHVNGNNSPADYGACNALTQILSFIDALEVKEVDIRSEVSNWWNNHYTSTKKGYTFEGYSGHYMENSTIVSLAQYFFELGLRTQKGE